eukprot:gene4836-34592_t
MACLDTPSASAPTPQAKVAPGATFKEQLQLSSSYDLSSPFCPDRNSPFDNDNGSPSPNRPSSIKRILTRSTSIEKWAQHLKLLDELLITGANVDPPRANTQTLFKSRTIGVTRTGPSAINKVADHLCRSTSVGNNSQVQHNFLSRSKSSIKSLLRSPFVPFPLDVVQEEEGAEDSPKAEFRRAQPPLSAPDAGASRFSALEVDANLFMEEQEEKGGSETNADLNAESAGFSRGNLPTAPGTPAYVSYFCSTASRLSSVSWPELDEDDTQQQHSADLAHGDEQDPPVLGGCAPQDLEASAPEGWGEDRDRGSLSQASGRNPWAPLPGPISPRMAMLCNYPQIAQAGPAVSARAVISSS